MTRYQVGGSVSAETSVYIERQADSEIFQALQDGDLCYVFNSRQMGKSSLLLQVKSKLQSLNYRCCFVDISRIGSVSITPEQWYGGLTSELWRGFGLPPGKAMFDWWKSCGDIPPAQKLASFFDQQLLPHYPDQQLTVFFDEVDSVLSLPFAADDFFSVIRALYNQRADKPDCRRLNFSLYGVAIPADLMQDARRSPFNIGRAISLEGFTEQEAAPLAAGLNSDSELGLELLHGVLAWSGGQPFLTQKLCQMIVNDRSAETQLQQLSAEVYVEKLVDSQIIDDWERNDNPEHLRTIRDRMVLDEAHSLDNLNLYGKLLAAPQETLNSEDIGDYSRLYLTGLIANKKGKLSPRTRIYRSVFDENWVQHHLQARRPYNDKISLWLDSGREDEQWLLRGLEYTQAQQWAQDKHLPEDDHRYLAASQELEKREVQQWNDRLQEEVAQRRHAEKKLQYALNDLEKAKSDAELANQAKTEFLARVSHEVRTPINGVLGLSYLALQHESAPTSRDYLKKIQRSAGHMLDVVNDMVDISRIEKGELQLVHETFYIDDILDSLVDMVSLKIHQQGLNFSLNSPCQLLPAVQGDPLRLKQLLVNLCSQLIRPKEINDVCIDLTVEQSASKDSIQLTFIFHDGTFSNNDQSVAIDNLNVEQEYCYDLARLMKGKLSYRNHSSPVITLDLLLPLAADTAPNKNHPKQKIAMLMAEANTTLQQQLAFLGHHCLELDLSDIDNINSKGVDCIVVDSKLLQHQSQMINLATLAPDLRCLINLPSGATLPHWIIALGGNERIDQPCSLRKLANTINQIGNSENPVKEPSKFGKKHRVLVAEDDEINQQIVQELLIQIGLDVTLASNGQEALDALQKNTFQLILMDIEMPILGGMDAVKKIRQLKASAKTDYTTLPIVAMTAHALIEDRQKFLAAGMNDHISKPIEPAILFEILQHWLPENDQQQLPKVQSTSAHLTIDGINYPSGLHHCNDNQALFHKLLQQFAHQYISGLKFEQQDLSTLRASFHSIKGSSSNLGATAISRLAAELETIARSNQQPSLLLVEQFNSALIQQCRLIQATLSHEPAAHLTQPPVSEENSRSNKDRILIVDDQPENLHLLSEVLKKDYSVIATTSGAKVLELAKRQPQPKAILLDVMMPEMDGYQVCEALKQDDNTKDIPVLFVSGADSEEDYRRGITLGACDFIQKPISPTLLQQRLKRLL